MCGDVGLQGARVSLTGELSRDASDWTGDGLRHLELTIVTGVNRCPAVNSGDDLRHSP